MSRLMMLGAGKPLTAAYAGPFDGITFAALYGMKRYLTAYTGNLVRLRRSSDNAESDFGPVAATGLLDTAAIATFLGASNGFVVTWYDQSGNGLNVTQSTAAKQPAYVASGVNSLPTVRFAATSSTSLVNADISVSQPTTHLMALTFPAHAGGNNYMFDGIIGRQACFRNAANQGQMYAGTQQTVVHQTSGWAIHLYEFNGTSSRFHLNGSTPSSESPGTDALGGLRIGARTNEIEGLNGDYAAYFVLGAALDAATKNTLGNELETLYALTWTDVT